MFELNLLEYSKILAKINNYSKTEEAKEYITNLTPSVDKNGVFLSLKEVDELKIVFMRLGRSEIEEFKFYEAIQRLRLNALLSIDDFIELRKIIFNSNKLINLFKKAEALEIDLSSTYNYYKNFESLKDIKNEIDLVFDPDGLISDNASTELFQIRKRIKVLEQRLTEKYNQFIKNEGSKLSELIITIRNGHKVLPVKTEYKGSIKGVNYGESASGQTTFIEPFQCLEIQNSIDIEKQNENREIDRILYILSNKTYEFFEPIKTNYELLIHYDIVFSKVNYAFEIDGVLPLISDEVNLINARHPLIDKEKIVPNTIKLNKRETVIITGPNTGGKTVVLKTLGLMELLAQSGILIPVDEKSSIHIFDSILADIGDEQSIEQSLSTFSSHMTRIVNILENGNSNSLILLDELGSGTDPKEGASLAISIINYMRNKKMTSMVTTHYPELKAYAYNNENVINASVEFDVNTLKPTYKLLTGTPGKSNAFLISKRLGLNEEIINDARMISNDFNSETSSLIEKLEKESLRLNKKIKEYESLNSDLKKSLDEAKKKEKEIKESYKIEMQKAYDERNKILEKSQAKASKLIEEIKELKNELIERKEIKDDKIITLKGKTNDLYHDKFYKERRINHEINENDHVRVIQFNQVGIVSKIKDNKYYVTMGSINSIFKKEDLEYVEVIDEKKKVVERKNTSSTDKLKTDTKAILDIRGERYEDAYNALESFIDSAILSNLNQVHVIHGFGSLVLRNMVIKYCEKNKLIKSFRPGNETEGGNGSTIIYLK